jgi:Ca2+-binding EF-hand superfamily protein
MHVDSSLFKEADEDGGGGLDLDEFRQAMIKTMAGKAEIVSQLKKNQSKLDTW